jgi:hypothetical protein
MRQEYPDDPDGIRAAIREEVKRSRFRDRSSGGRVHPIQHDVNMVLDFIIDRRRRQAPAVFDAARKVLKHVDTEALRFLVSTVLEDGRCDNYMNRRCARLLEYCATIDSALALKGGHH